MRRGKLARVATRERKEKHSLAAVMITPVGRRVFESKNSTIDTGRVATNSAALENKKRKRKKTDGVRTEEES